MVLAIPEQGEKLKWSFCNGDLYLTSNLGKAKGGSFQKNKKKPIGSGGATLI